MDILLNHHQHKDKSKILLLTINIDWPMNTRENQRFVRLSKRVFQISIVALFMVSCSLMEQVNNKPVPIIFPTRIPFQVTASALIPTSANIPGQFLDYLAQTGDTLASVAAHFNTSEETIRVANPRIPLDATTLQPGSPMKIPFIDLPGWGSPYKIIPDEFYINGPLVYQFQNQ